MSVKFAEPHTLNLRGWRKRFFFFFPFLQQNLFAGIIMEQSITWWLTESRWGRVKRRKGKLQNFTLTGSCHCTHNQPLRFYLWNLQVVQGWSSKDQTSWFYHFQARWIDLPYFSCKFFICEMGIRLQAILTRL